MGVEWETDPFEQEVDLDTQFPQCPFRPSHETWCRAVRKRGVRKDWVYPPCPAKERTPKGMVYKGAPPECPLRHGEIVIRRKP